MDSVRDAQINDMIRLKQPPAAPVERWQIMPCSKKTQTGERVSGQPCHQRTPLKSKTAKTKTPNGTRKTHKTPQNTPGRNRYTPTSCRYIPNRATTDMEYSSFLIRDSLLKQKEDRGKTEGEGNEEKDDKDGRGSLESPGREEYRQGLLSALSRSRGHQQRGVLSFKSTTPASTSCSYLEYDEIDVIGASASHTKSARSVPITPEKVMDAPTLKDDYYLNTLDWGKNNLMALGLESGVYLWNAINGSTRQLFELKEEGNYVTSVSWSGNGKYLAIGDSLASVQLWDVEKGKRIRTMKGHSDRVGVLAWNKHTVSSASRDGLILHNDVRKADHVVAKSSYHEMEVCGLQWAPDGSKLASGGNDNLVCVWSASNPSQPAQLLRGHQAAVKAVAWCPWQSNVLATGGGTNDRSIRFWNVFTGQCTETVDAQSQVSSLKWNKYHKQLISAHGHPKNHMVVWQYPCMKELATLTGHAERILHMVLSPRRTRVASASSDETVRIWKCFKPRESSDQSCSSEGNISALLHSTLHLDDTV